MNAIMAALRSGIAPGVIHSMVDMAAAALRVTAPAPSPASPTCHRTVPADSLHPSANHPTHASPTRPSVSSPKQLHSQAKRGSQSGLKSVLKTAAGREPAEHSMTDRAASDAAARTEAPAVVDAPYRYQYALTLPAAVVICSCHGSSTYHRGGSCCFHSSGLQLACMLQDFDQIAPDCIITLALLLMQNSILALSASCRSAALPHCFLEELMSTMHA